MKFFRLNFELLLTGANFLFWLRSWTLSVGKLTYLAIAFQFQLGQFPIIFRGEPELTQHLLMLSL